MIQPCCIYCAYLFVLYLDIDIIQSMRETSIPLSVTIGVYH